MPEDIISKIENNANPEDERNFANSLIEQIKENSSINGKEKKRILAKLKSQLSILSTNLDKGVSKRKNPKLKKVTKTMREYNIEAQDMLDSAARTASPETEPNIDQEDDVEQIIVDLKGEFSREADMTGIELDKKAAQITSDIDITPEEVQKADKIQANAHSAIDEVEREFVDKLDKEENKAARDIVPEVDDSKQATKEVQAEEPNGSDDETSANASEKEFAVTGLKEEIKDEKAKSLIEQLNLEIDSEKIPVKLKARIKDDKVELNAKTQKEIIEYMDSLGLELDGAEKESIIKDFNLALDGAVDAETDKEFSKLKHHKGVIAAGIGIAGVAAAAGVAFRMYGLNLIPGLKQASGAVAGGAAGGLRGAVREILNPIKKKLSKKNQAKRKEIKKEAKKKVMYDEKILKTTIAQMIRQKSLEKTLGYKVDQIEDNADEILKNEIFEDYKPEEKENAKKALMVLASMSKATAEKAEDNINDKQLGEIAKGTALGAVFGGISDIGRNIKSIVGIESATDAGLTSSLGGVAGGVMTGHAIDKWQEGHFDKKKEAAFIEDIKLACNDDLEGENAEKNKQFLKAAIENERLLKYPMILNMAKDSYMKLVIAGMSTDKRSKDILKGLFEGDKNVDSSSSSKEIEDKFKKGRLKMRFLSYALGVGAGLAISSASVWARDFAEDVKASMDGNLDIPRIAPEELDYINEAASKYGGLIRKEGLDYFKLNDMLEDMQARDSEMAGLMTRLHEVDINKLDDPKVFTAYGDLEKFNKESFKSFVFLSKINEAYEELKGIKPDLTVKEFGEYLESPEELFSNDFSDPELAKKISGLSGFIHHAPESLSEHNIESPQDFNTKDHIDKGVNRNEPVLKDHVDSPRETGEYYSKDHIDDGSNGTPLESKDHIDVDAPEKGPVLKNYIDGVDNKTESGTGSVDSPVEQPANSYADNEEIAAHKNREYMELKPEDEISAKEADILSQKEPTKLDELNFEADIKKPAQVENAIVKQGNGIEKVFIRQLVEDPEKYGYDESVHGPNPEKWAGAQAHRIALKAGYVDANTGQEVWLKRKAIGDTAYLLNNTKEGLVVEEMVKHDDGNFYSTEYHNTKTGEHFEPNTRHGLESYEEQHDRYEPEKFEAQTEKVKKSLDAADKILNRAFEAPEGKPVPEARIIHNDYLENIDDNYQSAGEKTFYMEKAATDVASGNFGDAYEHPNVSYSGEAGAGFDRRIGSGLDMKEMQNREALQAFLLDADKQLPIKDGEAVGDYIKRYDEFMQNRHVDTFSNEQYEQSLGEYKERAEAPQERVDIGSPKDPEVELFKKIESGIENVLDPDRGPVSDRVDGFALDIMGESANKEDYYDQLVEALKDKKGLVDPGIKIQIRDAIDKIATGNNMDLREAKENLINIINELENPGGVSDNASPGAYMEEDFDDIDGES